MFAAIDGGMLGLALLLAALGILPGLLALNARKADGFRQDRGMPRPMFRFGAATAARGTGL